MKDNDFWDEKEKKYIEKDEETKRRFPTLFLLIIFTTVGVLLALGLSFSAISLLNGEETINTIISNISGDDNKDKYIITFVESAGDIGNNGQTIVKDEFLHIIGAKVSDTKDGAKGEVIFFGGLMLTTKNTFSKNGSTVTYEVILKNDSSTNKTFEKILFNTNGNVKYTISGIKQGDIVKPGQEVKTYITVEYSDDKNTKYPITIESSVDISYRKEDAAIHITDAKINGTKNGGKGEIEYFEGLFITTKNTFENSKSQVSYKLTIKNDSSQSEAFSGIVYNSNGNVKYTISGIKNGDVLEPGQTVTIYLLVEPNGNLEYPITIEDSVEVRYTTFSVVDEVNAINLVKQFPTPDAQGKLFEGPNYVYSFSLLVGKKTLGAYYEITAVPINDNTLSPDYVKLYIEKNNKPGELSIKENGKVKTYSEYQKSEHEEAEGKLVYSGTITNEDINNGKIEFKLRMWVSDELKINESNMEEFNDKKFGVKINTYAQFQR